MDIRSSDKSRIPGPWGSKSCKILTKRKICLKGRGTPGRPDTYFSHYYLIFKLKLTHTENRTIAPKAENSEPVKIFLRIPVPFFHFPNRYRRTSLESIWNYKIRKQPISLTSWLIPVLLFNLKKWMKQSIIKRDNWINITNK